VQECCEDDNEIYGEGEIWPHPKTLTYGNQNLRRWLCSGISTTVQNSMQIGSGVSFLRMRDFAPLGAKVDSAIFCEFLRKATAEMSTSILTQSMPKAAQGSAF